jgi:Fe-S-cluster containining protein
LPHGAPDEIERAAYKQRLEAFLASRDAGCALTADSLRAGIRLRAIVGAATDVATYADTALAIVLEEYRPPLDCHEGCSYCCSKPGVLVSIPDLLRILDHVRSACDLDALAALRGRAARYAAQMAGRRFDDPIDESVPCPLLVHGRCSVYDIRPLVCRGYNSTDVNACRDAHEHSGALVPIFAVLKDVTDGATVGVAQSLEAAGLNASLVDLGSAVHIALEAGHAFPQAIVDGDPALARAENRSWVSDLWTRVQETARQIEIPV